MTTNLDRYRADLDRVIETGGMLHNAMGNEIAPDQFRKVALRALDKEAADNFIKKLPSFKAKYQAWYSEALALLRQLLPDRVDDFVAYYERPKARKTLDYGNYVIRDYLDGLQRSDGSTTTSAAYPKFEQQLSIVAACKVKGCAKCHPPSKSKRWPQAWRTQCFRWTFRTICQIYTATDQQGASVLVRIFGPSASTL